MKNLLAMLCMLVILAGAMASVAQELTYVIVDTGLEIFYDDAREIEQPQVGERFYGQDGHYVGTGFSFQDNGDGTVSDLNTGLMWQKSPDFDSRVIYDEAMAYAENFELAGYDDWRVPTVKQLISIADFNGNIRTRTPYLNTDYFDFEYPPEGGQHREIDVQFWSSDRYVGRIMRNELGAFGYNFADGHQKGYPAAGGPSGGFFVRLVRGAENYGVNDFVDNDNGTVTDQASGLTWQQVDDGNVRNWEDALSYAEGLSLAGHDDWRLPNIKELQSIVDYTRAPDARDGAPVGPAIDPALGVTETESWFWSSTTQLDNTSLGMYICFGQALSVDEHPNGDQVNAHGAGAQRSDPKSGNPADYAGGMGPQRDEVRILNYVRCVRGRSGQVSVGEKGGSEFPTEFLLSQNYPNPFNSITGFKIGLPTSSSLEVAIYNLAGRKIETLVKGHYTAGYHTLIWEAGSVSAGTYLINVKAGEYSATRKIVLLR
jgi:hypothetical protein